MDIKEGQRFVLKLTNGEQVYLTVHYNNGHTAWLRSEGSQDCDYRYTMATGKLHKWVLVGWDLVENVAEFRKPCEVVIEFIS